VQQQEDVGLPVRAVLHETGMYLALRQIGREQLQDAFMQETIARVPAEERIVHIAREKLGQGTRDSAPVGIIFHVARCGSTLVSQLLKQLDVIVYAEPQPVNELLAPPEKWPRADVVAALRSLGAVMASHARQRYVLKLSSWNTLYCDIVGEAFPDTPWILSLRDPIEVGVSLLSSPPGWFQPTTEAARGLATRVHPAHASTSREEFIARTYAAFCTAAAGLNVSRGRLVTYDSLPAAVWQIVAPHFSLSVDPAQLARIAEAARRNAKTPIGTVSEFASDAAAKQAAASSELHRAVDSIARPQLEQLMLLHTGTIKR
jgi:hypothetical protein